MNKKSPEQTRGLKIYVLICGLKRNHTPSTAISTHSLFIESYNTSFKSMDVNGCFHFVGWVVVLVGFCVVFGFGGMMKADY
ncbi:MAG: hypothetical protein JST20_02440 [Bacteroidetes bacterium]|nr:hypothetical protein [Bacteroidota bacterium]